MLVKRPNAQLGHKPIILAILFLFLVLLVYPINGKASNVQEPEYIDVTEGTKIVSISGVDYSANSKIFVGRTYWDFNWEPEGRLRWYLYNPEGNIVYYEEADWHETDEAADIGYVNDPEIVVPNFPQQGNWKLALCFRDPILGRIDKTMLTCFFSVGESSFVDNIMAPWYLTWGGILDFGAFSIALPGIFWITSPFWIIGLFFILLVFYTRSYRLAVGLIKEGGKRFKEAIKG